MTNAKTLTVDGFKVALDGERNLLEVIRKAHIELPTFCYHSELSIYGACRLCMVDVEGRGMVASCSTLPEPGMRVRTQTPTIRAMRRVNLELLLASGDHDCPTCGKPATKTQNNKLPEAFLFRDVLSAQEYRISGMCQSCQDGVFGVDQGDDE